MEEGNLYRRRKRGPDGEGGGSDPAGSGGRLAMLFRLGVGRAKSKFYDHSLCWRDVLFFKNVSKFNPPPPEQDEESTKLSGRIVVRIIFDHAATQHSKMKIRLTMHAAYSSPGAPMQEARKILLAAWGDSQDSPAVGGGIGIR